MSKGKPASSKIGQLIRSILATAVQRESEARKPRPRDWVAVGPGREVVDGLTVYYYLPWSDDTPPPFRTREMLRVELDGHPALRATVAACDGRGVTVIPRGINTFPPELPPGQVVVDDRWVLARLWSQLLEGFPGGNDALALELLDPPSAPPPVPNARAWPGNRLQAQGAEEAMGDGARWIRAGPGTGKTRLIAEVVRALEEEEHRALVVAPSNEATDASAWTICERLQRDERLRPGRVIRAGNPRSQAFRDRYGQDTDPWIIAAERHANPGPEEVQRIIDRAAVVVAPTARVWLSRYLCEARFDTVLLDEAGMTSLAAAYRVAMNANRTVAVVGDDRQLRSIARSRERVVRSFLSRSAFDTAARGRPPGVTLETQYRMDPAIMNVLNNLTYGNRLSAGAPIRQRIPTEAPALTLVDTSPCPPSSGAKASTQDATHARIIRELLRSGPFALSRNPRPSAVLSRYRAQVALLLKWLPQSRHLQVHTIHRAQASEFDTVILDMSSGQRCWGDHLTAIAPEDDGGRLLTAALSRARRHVVVVADVAKIRAAAGEGPPTMAVRLIDYLIRHGSVVLGDQIGAGALNELSQSPELKPRCTS